MKLARKSAVFVFCISLLSIAQNPHVDWVRGTDFSKFRTFTWAKSHYAIQDPYANLSVAAAVQDELAAKGVHFLPSEEKFDVFVTYTVRINQDTLNLSQNVLTMNIRIFDSHNNTVVWSAGGYTPITKEEAQDRRKARELLASMFQKYPPQ
jgi:Domain of unknown function (DUF4136)